MDMPFFAAPASEKKGIFHYCGIRVMERTKSVTGGRYLRSPEEAGTKMLYRDPPEKNTTGLMTEMMLPIWL